jgi:hypothetical protein
MATRPSAPSIQNAPRASPNTLEYYWYPPASEGSAPITGYRLTLQPGNLVYTPGPTQYYKVTGLTNGQTYQTSIAATNDNGATYGPTANFREFQPGSPPTDPPATATATRLSTESAVINWDPSISTPDAQIFWYVVKSQSTNPTDPVIKTNGYALSQSNVIISGLNSNSQYTFQVQPVNCPGYGPSITTNSINMTFAPNNLSNLSLWLDANDETTVLRSGANVTGWTDKSGYSNNSLSNFGTIVYNSNAQNGKNIIQFQQGAFVGGFTPAYTGSAITYFFVGTLSNVNSEFSVIMSVGKYNDPDFDDQENMNVFGREQNTSNFVSYRNLPPYTATTISPGAYNTYGIAAVVVDGSGPTQTAFYNGTQVSQVTYGYTPNFNMQAWSIGSGDRSSNMSYQYTIFSGDYAEGVLFETALSTNDRQSMEGYLAWKWGLVASLPSNHPYKNAAP